MAEISELPGIYWIQAFSDGEWQNLQRCDDHDDAIVRIGPLLTDRRFSEVRLVLAQSQDGRIEYTTLVKTRDGVVVSDALLETPLPPEPAAASRKLRAAVLSGVLVTAVVGGLGIAYYNQEFAITLFKRATTLAQPDLHLPKASVVQTVKNIASTVEPTYTSRLFAAVDADDAAAIRRLMVARPRDLALDELHDFVDDGWGTGPRAIVDYALLGGHLATAAEMLSAGATPTDWLRDVIARNAGQAKLRPAVALLIEFGALPEISAEAVTDNFKPEPGAN